MSEAPLVMLHLDLGDPGAEPMRVDRNESMHLTIKADALTHSLNWETSSDRVLPARSEPYVKSFCNSKITAGAGSRSLILAGAGAHVASITNLAQE
jgi:hypothetical protein